MNRDPNLRNGLPVPRTGVPRGRAYKFTGRCDVHTYCSDCKTKRGRRRGNRRVRRMVREALRVA